MSVQIISISNSNNTNITQKFFKGLFLGAAGLAPVFDRVTAGEVCA